jgi:DNA-binding transcriptional LysR family regulator
MISQNIGVSVLPENAVMIPTYDNLCFVPIEGFIKTIELYLQWHSKRIISPAATAFMELVKDMARRHAKCHR